MSLLKAYNNINVVRPRDAVLEDFRTHLDGVLALDNNVTKEDVAVAIAFYAEYSLGYLTEVALTFKEPEGASSTMKFMNSFIAELMNLAGLRYFDLDKGYSVVDKAVQLALGVGGYPPMEAVLVIINDIEDSYKVEDEAKAFEATQGE